MAVVLDFEKPIVEIQKKIDELKSREFKKYVTDESFLDILRKEI